MAGACTDWRTAGISVAGASHRRTGFPCQDAHLCQQLAGGVLVAAVADGAGSAPRADVGSACAVRAAVKEAVNQLGGLGVGLPREDEDWHLLLRHVLQAARKAVATEAAARGWSLSDLATTLLLALATPDLVAAGQVGDGAVVARLDDNRFQAVTRPPVQEYVNETTFLTSGDPLGPVQVSVLRARPSGLALFSDGLQMLALKMPEGTPHPPFFAPLLRLVADIKDRSTAEEQLQRFFQSPRITERADDDLTLLLAVRDGS
jgi:hypothetical protein